MSDHIESSLRNLTKIYLLFPIYLFLIFWISPWVSIPILFALLVYTFKVLVPGLNFSKLAEELYKFACHHWIWFLVVIASLTFWFLWSGSGGFSTQMFDYRKHNGVMIELLKADWPVLIKTESGLNPLIYNLGLYLVPGFFGKFWSSFKGVEVVSFIWNAMGVALAGTWYLYLAWNHERTKRSAFFLFFGVLWLLFFGGFDWIGNLIVKGEIPRWTSLIEWWPGDGTFQLSSNTTLLYWVPQHFLGGWLGTFLVLARSRKLEVGETLLILALTSFWSLLAAAGLGLLILIQVLIERRFEYFKFEIDSEFIIGFACLAVFALYFSLNTYPHKSLWMFTKMGTDFWWKYPLFVMLEFGVVAGLFYFFRNKTLFSSFEKNLFLSALICLCLIPWYFFGMANDWVMRGSVPALLVFQLVILRNLDFSNLKIKVGFVVLTCFLASTPLNQMILVYRYWPNHMGSKPLFEAQHPELSRQYLGNITTVGKLLLQL